MAFDVQIMTPRSKGGYKKIVVVLDVFTRFVRVVPVRNEKAKTAAKVLIKK